MNRPMRIVADDRPADQVEIDEDDVETVAADEPAVEDEPEAPPPEPEPERCATAEEAQRLLDKALAALTRERMALDDLVDKRDGDSRRLRSEAALNSVPTCCEIARARS